MRIIDYILSPFRLLLGWPLKLASASRSLLGMSLPARVALLLGLFLVLLVATAYVGVFLTDQDRTHWYEWIRPTRVIGIICLCVAAPLVIYQALRLWLEGGDSRFPDIDRAWKDGLSALSKQGLSLDEVPLFLVLGASDERHGEAVMRASGLKFSVPGAPDGRAPLRWYVNERAAFLVCSGAGCLSRLNRQKSPVAESGGIQQTLNAGEQRGVTGTLAAAGVTASAYASSDASISGTNPTDAGGDIYGTLQPSIEGTAVAGSAAPQAVSRPAAEAVSHRELDEEAGALVLCVPIIASCATAAVSFEWNYDLAAGRRAARGDDRQGHAQGDSPRFDDHGRFRESTLPCGCVGYRHGNRKRLYRVDSPRGRRQIQGRTLWQGI